MKSSASIHSSFVISLLIYCSLCSLHASGKKRRFAEFVKQMRGEIEQATKTYTVNFPNSALHKFLKANLPLGVAVDITTNQASIYHSAWMIHQLFRGDEITYSDQGYSVLQTDCAGRDFSRP